MFKAGRWRSDTSKISALFKLRFHATKVSQLGEKDLVLSLVPADTGKPTAKLDKYQIRDGCCYWENPIFETVKFIQDPKTGKIHERIYYFIISTGSSKLSILGEVSVNLAEHAGTTKATSVSLPFKGSNSDVVLHVLIQRIQENVDQRELEGHEGAKIKPEDRSLRSFFSNIDAEENININSTEVSFRGGAKSKPEDRSLRRYFSNRDAEENINLNPTEEEPLRKTVSNIAELKGNRRASIVSDITSSSSDSSSGLDTPRELGKKSNSLLLDSIAHNQGRTGWELALVTTHDSSADDSTNGPRDAFPKGRSQLASDDSVEKLKSDLFLLSRKAEVADMELQTLRKQIVKEGKRGQELLKEVVNLKEERDALKKECEKLEASQKSEDEVEARVKSNCEGDPWVLLEETRQQLNDERDLNVNLQLRLQKTQESNSELILAVQDLEQMLDQCKRGNFDLSFKPVYDKISENLQERCLERHGLSDDDEEQKALEEIVKQHSDAKEAYMLEQKIMDLCSEIEMYRRDKDELEMQLEQLALDYEILKQENHDMSSKLDQRHLQERMKLQYESSSSYAIINELENRVKNLEREIEERSNEFSDSLATIKQLENDTQNLEAELQKQAQEFKDEIKFVTGIKVEKEQQAIRAEEALRLATVQLENQMKKLEDALKKKSKEYSDAMSTIKGLEDQIQSLEEELDKQAQAFEFDLEAVTHAKVEQEQRAIRAEEALRLTRWKNANSAGRLQDEFKTLSMQIQSTFEANEKAATNAMTEASELRLINNHLEELLQQAKEELHSVKDDYEAQVNDLHNQLTLKMKQIHQMLLDIEEKSNQLNHPREPKDEICQSLSAELLLLRAEIDRLIQMEQGADLKAEIEQVKALVNERYLLLQMEKREREKPTVELNAIRCLNNENDAALSNLQSEVDTLKAHCEELRHALHKDELEKENLRKQVTQLKAELKKKDDALFTMERKLKDNNGRPMALERTKSGNKNSKFDQPPLNGSKEATNLTGKIKLLEGQIKQKETALETSANAFLEKEKDLHNKIEELETKLEELNHSSTTCCEYERRKVDGNAGEFNKPSDDSYEPVDNVVETSGNRIKGQYNIHAFLEEMASLREKNAYMGTELSEMQERYSEISLKFAEVEGERQQLVMALRSMKNSKR